MQAVEVKSLLEAKLPDTQVEVEGEGCSFQLNLISDALASLSPVKRQQQVYAQSAGELNFTGMRKVGVITSDDITKGKAELLEALKTQAQQAVAAQNPDAKVLATVLQQVIETPANIGDEAESFTLSGKATIAVVVYQEKDLLAQANQMLAKQIVDASEVLESANAAPSVTVNLDYLVVLTVALLHWH